MRATRQALCALLAAALAGCATFSAPRVTEIKVPVPVPCRAPDVPRPLFAVDSLPLGADVLQQMRALRAERQQRAGYEAELEAVLLGCRG